MSITVRNVSKRFGTFTALHDINLELPHGSLIALLGPSGCGKTTLLRIIAGLETADTGTVLYQHEDITDQKARDRQVGFVFQHYALFRHMTVFENVAFALRIRKWPQKQVEARVRELLGLVRLDGFDGRYPAQLSGGQRQRVALARALAAQPRVLLLDEPFGALDAKVRQELRQWLRRLHDEIHVTSIFVTHDQEEAFEVADQVVVMNRGRIEQIGTPQQVFDQPANPFVMDFLGDVNVFHGREQAGQVMLQALARASIGKTPTHPQAVNVYVRPHELDVSTKANGVPSFAARVAHVNPAGSLTRLHLRAVEGNELIVAELNPERASELQLRQGDLVYVSARRVRVFEPEYVI
ncbi:MAG: TOBE-like domain-containing protein [Gemmataceae bacterium]